MRHHECPAVEYEVRDEPVEKLTNRGGELRRFECQLLERFGEPVRHTDLTSAERPVELGLVVTRDHHRRTVTDHPHCQPQHARGVGSSVDEIADEDRCPACGMRGTDGPPGVVESHRIAEFTQQGHQLRPAAVHIADDIERAVQVAIVAVEPGPRDARGVDLFNAAQHVHPAEPLALQPTHTSAELVALAPQHIGAEIPVAALGIAGGRNRQRRVEDDGYRQHVVVAGQRHQLGARCRLHVGRVDDGEPPRGQALRRHEVQRLEGGLRRTLGVFVIGDEPAEKSEDSTSVRAKCFAAKLDLPDPEIPMSTTRESSGISIMPTPPG